MSRKVITFLVGFSSICLTVSSACQNNTDCSGNGVCKNDICYCNNGWQGPQCQHCSGKVRLDLPSGTIQNGPGNYSSMAKCSWLIDAPNSSITLHLEQFATECGWDHLYIFDGDSVDSPLLAAFSGLMYKDNYSVRRVPEVVAKSGSALIHFSSDDVYSTTGFKISYRLNTCPSKISSDVCSGHGVCIDGVCYCEPEWKGDACHLEMCPNNCGAKGHGKCDSDTGCICNSGYKGDDCSQIADDGYWETIDVERYVPPGRASHGAVVWKDSMYVIGGESFGNNNKNSSEIQMHIFDFEGNVWESPTIKGSPLNRNGHSTVIYGDKIYIYGGNLGNQVATSELWAFDISAKTWEKINTINSCDNKNIDCTPLKSIGHSATVINDLDMMVVIFGYSPEFGYHNIVQEYYFHTKKWHIVNTKGYPVEGKYGHSASLDPLTKKIYVYGGYSLYSVLSRSLYSYDYKDKVWTSLTSAPSYRFLHTATFISDGLMLVFGGNTHNDTTYSTGAKCYSSEVSAYDVVCDTWHTLETPKNIRGDFARFGHSAVTFEKSLYIYGGFDGQMLTDIVKYTSGECSHYEKYLDCHNKQHGVKCFWDEDGILTGKCLPIRDYRKKLIREHSNPDRSSCPPSGSLREMMEILDNDKDKCQAIKDCASCLQCTSECVWWGTCHYIQLYEDYGNATIISELENCPIDPTMICDQLYTCEACTSHESCKWDLENHKCKIQNNETAATTVESAACPKSCTDLNSCGDCTERDYCLWCHNKRQCLHKTAFAATFPYGQCRDWTAYDNKKCSFNDETIQCNYKTVSKCQEDPACGWCDDGSRTGTGRCLLGGFSGSKLSGSSSPSETCAAERWYFTKYPDCQCNGHASCVENTSKCLACANLTTGPHCEQCIKGYWGDPTNGGTCKPCECNGKADECHPETGKCYCTIKGTSGDHCEKCDASNNYYPDPINNVCLYQLTTDYRYTFNLSKPQEKQYTQINFVNSPTKALIDTTFVIKCSRPATMDLTVRQDNASKEERMLFNGYNCSTDKFKTKFLSSEYKFGVEKDEGLTTFIVHLYDLKTPLWIEISFYQVSCFTLFNRL